MKAWPPVFSYSAAPFPELGRHVRHMDADLPRIIVQPRADDAEPVRRQDAAINPSKPTNIVSRRSGKPVRYML